MKRLSEAINAGLFHPNCRHSISAYVEGLTPHRQKSKSEMARDEKERRERQEQNYIKRMINKWNKRVKISITEEEREYSKRKLREWRKKLK
jgi:hypothetical protein